MTMVRIVAAKCSACGEEMTCLESEGGQRLEFPTVMDALELHVIPNECGYCGGQVMVATEPLPLISEVAQP